MFFRGSKGDQNVLDSCHKVIEFTMTFLCFKLFQKVV